MVIRVMSLPDYLDLPDFDEVFRAILGWDGQGFIFRVHGQEFNSFRRRTQSKTLREFQFRVFRRWYPRFRPQPQTTSPEQKVA